MTFTNFVLVAACVALVAAECDFSSTYSNGYGKGTCVNNQATKASCTPTCPSKHKGTGIANCYNDQDCPQGYWQDFRGCEPYKCTVTLPAEYKEASEGSCPSGSQNFNACSVVCSDAATGVAVASCANDGDAFSFSGCSLVKCTADAKAGYNLDNCQGEKSPAECQVTCAADYMGTATATCNTNGGKFFLSGCNRKCAAKDLVGNSDSWNCGEGAATVAAGADVNHGATCTANCQAGYTPAANSQFTCTDSNTGAATPGDCKPECTLPANKENADGWTCNFVAKAAGEKITVNTNCRPTCNAGFEHKTTQLTCSAADTLNTADVAGCTAQPGCTLPAHKDNSDGWTCGLAAKSAGDHINVNANCRPKCTDGYEHTTTQLTCSADDTLNTADVAGCTVKPGCTLPANKGNADGWSCGLLGTATAAGARINVNTNCRPTCNEGYEQGSTPTLRCSAADTLNNDVTDCVAKPKCKDASSKTGCGTCKAWATDDRAGSTATVCCIDSGAWVRKCADTSNTCPDEGTFKDANYPTGADGWTAAACCDAKEEDAAPALTLSVVAIVTLLVSVVTLLL